jgi:hypothetical protein
MILDVFDVCTPEFQKRLMPIREKIKLAEDAKLDRERAKVFNNRLDSIINFSFFQKLGETVVEPKNLTRLPTSFPDGHSFSKINFKSNLFHLFRYRFK